MVVSTEHRWPARGHQCSRRDRTIGSSTDAPSARRWVAPLAKGYCWDPLTLMTETSSKTADMNGTIAFQTGIPFPKVILQLQTNQAIPLPPANSLFICKETVHVGIASLLLWLLHQRQQFFSFLLQFVLLPPSHASVQSSTLG